MDGNVTVDPSELISSVRQTFDSLLLPSLNGSFSDIVEQVLASEQFEHIYSGLLSSDPSTARQCSNDPFAIFGFLAFLLVLLQLLADSGGKRRKRSIREHGTDGMECELSALQHVMTGFMRSLNMNQGELKILISVFSSFQP